eukprot:3942662-Pyramimonas_sp.AAC.1
MLQAADSASSLAHAANSGATRSRTKPARTRIPPLVSSFRVLDSARARLGLAITTATAPPRLKCWRSKPLRLAEFL